MFEISFGLMIQNLLVNIFLPLIPGIIFLWIFYNDKFKGILLYILSWFVWIGVVAFTLFNLQFIHYWVWIKEYLFILLFLIIIFWIKLFINKSKISSYLDTLKIKTNKSDMLYSYKNLDKIKRVFFWIMSGFLSLFMINTFIFSISFPTYWDDSFGNRNTPAYNIYQDGWVKLFWEQEEILWRWRLGYPIYIPIYKALISDIVWFNDIYINMRQLLLFFGLVIFVIKITRDHTRNIFYSLLPASLIIWLPLIFFHSGEWYMELACAAYSIITLRFLWKFLEWKDFDYLSLALLFGLILSHVKNDWLLWYFAWIMIWFAIILLINNNLITTIKWFFKDKKNVLYSAFYLLFFLLPFLIIKKYYNLWFNQSVSNESGLWISWNIHTEIFSLFKPIFFDMDNYNIILVIVLLSSLYLYRKKNKTDSNWLLFIAPVIIFVIFILVFWLTENYIFAMNQTTINRVFTMSFVILLAFIWLFFQEEWKN